MKRNLIIIWTVLALILVGITVLSMAPGYWEYQQIRWRTKLPPNRVEAGMSGVLAGVKAMEQLTGNRPLTAKDFDNFSADQLKAINKLSEYDDLSMLLKLKYLNQLRKDPTGKTLKEMLYHEISSDIASRLQDHSNLADQLRVSAYELTLREPDFLKALLEKITSLDRLRLSDEQIKDIKEDWEEEQYPSEDP